MRDRIVTLIDTTPDPFATEIRYHRSCWKKHAKPCYNSSLDDNQIHLQEVRLTEVQQTFFNHVCTVVLEMNKPRTLQGLLLDYNQCSGLGPSTENTKLEYYVFNIIS